MGDGGGGEVVSYPETSIDLAAQLYWSLHLKNKLRSWTFENPR